MIQYKIYNQGINTMNPPDKTVLKVIHNAGYFSNLTIRLMDIMAFIKEHGHAPNEVDSSEQFNYYKDDAHIDVSRYYLHQNDEDIVIELPDREARMDCMAIQFDDYRKLDIDKLSGILDKYFTPGGTVMEKVDWLTLRYNLTEYISVFYRGNDKSTETETASYETFFAKAAEARERNPHLPFLLLPDECSFAHEFKKRFDNVIMFEETPCTDVKASNTSFEMPRGKRTQYGAYYNAAVILAANGIELITHSGNGGLWAAMYRNNPDGLHQCFKNKWYE